MTDRIGQQFGNYRLLRLIGHGGFADVYLGEHIYIGTQAAIKVLHTQLGNKEIERFRQEASMVARLEHPHIVRVLDFGVEDSVPFLVMSYAPNGTLRERHPRGTKLPLPLIVDYVRQVSEALQYAHNERIIHRDIKPENMLLGKHDEILLSDFGIALISQNSQSQSEKDLAGTAAYMAPEQIDARPRPASDQYALGIIVYEWISGSCPFTGTFTEIALKHAVAPPPLLSEKMPGFSPALEQVILTALAKDPANRFATVRDFARALEQASLTATIATDTAEAPTMLFAEGNRPALTPASDQVPPTLPSITPPGAGISGPMPAVHSVPPAALTPPRPQAQPGFPSTETPPGAGSSGPMPVVPPTVITPPGAGISGPMPAVPVTPPTIISQPGLVLPHPSPGVPSDAATTPGQADKGRRPGAPEGQGIVTPFIGFDAPLPLSSPTTDVPPPLPRRFSKGMLILLAGLVVLLIGGGVFSYFRFFAQPQPQKQTTHLSSAQILETAVATMQAGHPQAIDAYNQAVATNGTMFGFDAQHTHFNPYEAILGSQNIAGVHRIWTASTHSSILFSSPTVANGLVYVGAANGQLYAFNAETGQQEWVFKTGGPLYSSPAVANGLVYVGSSNDELYAFNAETGQQEWVFKTGGAIYSSPVVANGLVYVGSNDHKLYAFDARTGQGKWSASTGGAISYSSPAVANGLVYIGSSDHKLYAFDAESGKQKWTASTGNQILSSPAVADGLVYIGSNDDKLYAFNAETGQKKWSIAVGGRVFSSPSVVNGIVYVGSNSHYIYAFDARTGRQIWKSLTGDVIEASPIVANGLVYIGSWDHTLRAFNALSGQKAWSSAITGGKIYSSPTVANGIVYAASGDGKLHAFSLAR